MTRYEKKINDRKVLVNRLMAITGMEARYTRMPRCAYEVGPYTVEKNGDLTVPDENAEDSVIQTLVSEGLIGNRTNAAQTTRVVNVRRETVAQPQSAPVPPAAQPVRTVTTPFLTGTQEWDPDEDEEDETDSDTALEILEAEETEEHGEPEAWETAEPPAECESPLPEGEADNAPEEPAAQELEAEISTEEPDTQEPEAATAEEAETSTEEPAAQEPEEDPDTQEDAAELPEPEDSTDADLDDDIPPAIDEETAESAGALATPSCAPGFPMDTVVSLPLTGHTADSLKNLVAMVYSKGALISKATGGSFAAKKELVNELLDNTSLHTIAAVRGFLTGYEQEHGKALQGLTVTGDRIVFDGFTDTADADHVKTFTQLVSCMARTAKKQKRVVARETETENERYSMRTWLLRLGMNGPEFKEARKHLMANLTGHTAFRTAEEAERAKAKAQRKRDEMKAAKAADKEHAETQEGAAL